MCNLRNDHARARMAQWFACLWIATLYSACALMA
jgi:hypothetical protein